MGGEGSMQAMNTIIRNNRKLLRKKGLFNRRKSISDRKKELLSLAGGELEFKNISKEKLAILKSEIRKKAEKNRLKNSVFFVLIFVMILTVLKLHLNFVKTSERKQKARSEVLILQEHTKNYHIYMEDANDQFEKQHWKNAVYFYKKALLMLPKDSIANMRLQQSKENLSK